MNINVTSDRVDRQTGKYQFIMSVVLGEKSIAFSVPDVLVLFLSIYVDDLLALLLRNHLGDCQLILPEHCNQYTIFGPDRHLRMTTAN